jgi:hypothetical protein
MPLVFRLWKSSLHVRAALTPPSPGPGQRVREYLGSYLVRLNGEVDALVFTGGIGENSARIREQICEGLHRSVHSRTRFRLRFPSVYWLVLVCSYSSAHDCGETETVAREVGRLPS